MADEVTDMAVKGGSAAEVDGGLWSEAGAPGAEELVGFVERTRRTIASTCASCNKEDGGVICGGGDVGKRGGNHD